MNTECHRAARGLHLDHAAIHADFTCICPLGACQQFHQGALARAVVADQGDNLTLIELEIDVRERAHTSVELRQSRDGHQIGQLFLLRCGATCLPDGTAGSSLRNFPQCRTVHG